MEPVLLVHRARASEPNAPPTAEATVVCVPSSGICHQRQARLVQFLTP
jgi:hypothetical protein